MTRRRYIVVLALLCTFLAYAPICFALFRRIMYVFVRVVCLHEHDHPPPTDFFGLPAIPRTIDLCGHAVPVWAVALLWCLVPLIWMIVEFRNWIQRMHRERLGLCVQCGHRLRSWRGCCSGCGTRIGPGLPTRRHILNMPRNG